MRNTVHSATVERLHFLDEHCGIAEFARSTVTTWSSDIRDFLDNDSYSIEFRTGLGFLAVTGTYPTKGEFDPVRSLVAFGQGREALDRLRRLGHSAESRRTRLRVADAPLVDITRYSAERAISGIPRVVRNFVVSAPGQKLDRLVWSGGRVGRVTVDPATGHVGFPRAEWKRANRRARWATTTINSLRDLAARNPRLAFVIFGLAKWLPVPSVVLNVRHPEPRVSLFLHNTTVVVPEVMGRDVADRLTTWQRVGLGVSTRFIVHDLLPLTHSEFFAPLSTHEHLLNLEAYTAAERVFVATPLLAKDVDVFSTAIGRPTPETTVAPLPIVVADPTGESPQPSDPYVVFMGGYEQRKRLATFVDYVIAHRRADDRFTVVIVGRPPLITGRAEFDLLKRISRHRDIFRMSSGLTDGELRNVMAGALATVYISDAEGYGLPLLESLAVGTPVIAAPTELNHHLGELYGGVLAVFDDSPRAIEEIRKLTGRAYRNSITATISQRSIPQDIDAWASSVVEGIRL